MAYDAELQSYRKRVLEFINPKYYNKDELINFFDSPTEHNRTNIIPFNSDWEGLLRATEVYQVRYLINEITKGEYKSDS